MATGLYMLQDGSVMVAYGPRHIPISVAQYKANGYKQTLEKLTIAKSLTALKSRARPPVNAASPRPNRAYATDYFNGV
jgi:hypothetical protein